MKPYIVPASTANMFYAMCVTTIIVWASKEFVNIVIPNEVAAAITGLCTLVVGHLTTDSPTPTMAREAVANAPIEEKTP